MSNLISRMHLYSSRSSDVTAPLLYISMTWIIYQIAICSSLINDSPIPKGNLTVGHQGTAVLNCTTSENNPQVSWYRMSDGKQVSSNGEVLSSLQGRITILQSQDGRHQQIRISPVIYPEDNGDWRCSVFTQTKATIQESTLNIIEPPRKPTVSIEPALGLIPEVNTEGFIFTCSAPAANPPITLRWVEEPKPTTFEEVERYIVDGIMESQGINQLLQAALMGQPRGYPNQAPQTGNQDPRVQPVRVPSDDVDYRLPEEIPANLPPELIAKYANNPELIPDEYKHLVPQGGIPEGFQPPMDREYQLPGGRSSEGMIPPGYEDLILEEGRIPEGYRPLPDESPVSPPQTTVAKSGEDLSEEDRIAPYIPEGYHLPEEYRGRFPKGFEHLVATFLVKDSDVPEQEDGNQQEAKKRKRRWSENTGSQQPQRSRQQYQRTYGSYGTNPQGNDKYPQHANHGYQQPYPSQSRYPSRRYGSLRQTKAGASPFSSIDPLLLAELLHGQPDLMTLRQLAKITGGDKSKIPTEEQLKKLLESFDNPQLTKYAKYADFEPTPMRLVPQEDGSVISSVQLILTPLHHGRVYSCVAQHPAFPAAKNITKKMMFAIGDPKMADAGFKAPFNIPVHTMGSGKVMLIVLGGVLFLLASIVCILLYRFRKRWTLKVPSYSYSKPHTYIPIPKNDGNPDINNAPKNNNNLSNGIPPPQVMSSHMTTKATEKGLYIKKLLITGILMLFILILMVFMFPVYVMPFNVPVTGVDHFIPVMVNTQLWLACSSEENPDSDNLIQVTWRKNFTKFYTQYPVSSEQGIIKGLDSHSSSMGRVADTGVGSEMAGRVVDHNVIGQIGINPIDLEDQGFYMCEMVQKDPVTEELTYRRTTYVIAVLNGPTFNLYLLLMCVVGSILALILIGFTIYNSIKCHRSCKKDEAQPA